MKGKVFKYLVADTTAFINNVPLQDYADFILTVPDVVNEVKNKRQIRRLVVLPFDLQVQEPDSECLKYVTEFAKKTGDFVSLSAIDLKVVALTYELERQHVGTEHLRVEPIVKRVIASKNKPEELVEETSVAGFYLPSGTSDNGKVDMPANFKQVGYEEREEHSSINELKETEHDQPFTEKIKHKLTSEIKKEKTLDSLINTQTQNVEKILCSISVAEKNLESNKLDDKAQECSEHLNETDKDTLSWITEKIAASKINSDEEVNLAVDFLVPQINDSFEDDSKKSTGSLEENSEDDSTWITPANVKKVKETFKDEAEEEKNVIVACMSTDYAIQNVLKQINLNVAALNGRVIKHLRTYILRCYACFKTTSIMTKVFCPYCGNKTLKRVAVSLDENGQQVIHINLRRPLTRKFKNQSLPRPKGGKHSQNPILVEDQPIPKQMPSRVAKTKTNAMHEDYTAGYSPFVMRDVYSKSALLRTKGNIKQWARNNMYEENRRKKHSSRLLK